MGSQSAFQNHGYKLVPWLSWDEWNLARESLFSSTADSVATALRRISTWKSRGCLPVAIEITKLFVEIQQMDPFLRLSSVVDPSYSEDILAMLYSTAIIRLVNGVIEKTRNKAEVSIAEAACAIGLPSELIDIRHEASHRDLPSLQRVRVASIQALEWLKSYYWEPQKNAAFFQCNEAPKTKVNIEHRLHELFLCLKSREISCSRSTTAKCKGVVHRELLCASNKIFLLAATKRQSTKSGGSKKATARAFKHFVRLYSSFPLEVVSVLFEFLNSSMNSANISQGQKPADSLQISADDWKLLVGKFSKKEPKVLLNLISTVLDHMGQTWKGGYHFALSPESTAQTNHVEQLSSLIRWLAENLEAGERGDALKSKAIIRRLLQKCPAASASSRDHLMGSALLLAQLMGNESLSLKLGKLGQLGLASQSPESAAIGGHSPGFLEGQEESICQAAEKLEMAKRRVKGKPGRWVVESSWHGCPVGMLPDRNRGGSVLSVLSCSEGDDRPGGVVGPSGLRGLGGKREAALGMEVLDCRGSKKKRESVEVSGTGHGCLGVSDCAGGVVAGGEELPPPGGVEGRLLMGGVWKEVGEVELVAIKTAVRILV